MADLPAISVIVPIGPGEHQWEELVASLQLPDDSEILLSAGPHEVVKPTSGEIPKCVRIIAGKEGRASQMNTGALEARHDWLWFLHADSRLGADTLGGLQEVLKRDEKALFYFDLKFRQDGPTLMKLNEWAVRWRSNFLKIPFGDQGFVIKKSLFHELGSFPEDAPYGEDHLFVWKARIKGIGILPAGAGLLTSARKYQKGGWGKVTGLHVWLTLKQAAPQFLKWVKTRLVGSQG